VRQPPKE